MEKLSNSGNPLREKANSDFERIENGKMFCFHVSIDTSIEDRDQERGKECTCNQSAIRSRVSIVELSVSSDQEQRTRHSEGKQSGVCASTVEALRSRAIESSIV